MTTAQDSGEVNFCEQFFGLQEAPFSLAPNPRYLFESASHVAALAQLALAIERREPLVVVTGEIGTGKTLLCRLVLERQERQTFVSVINNSLLGRDDLLKQLLQDFGVISKDRTTALETSRHDLVHALEDFLTSLIALRAHAVVIIDEAQHIQFDVLEQIRLLSNIDEARGTALQIILVGQGDLEALLLRPEMRHFQQRVSRRLRLEPLSAEELPLYIEHRLAVARAATRSTLPGAAELARTMVEWDGSGEGVTFTSEAMGTIWRWSGGLPRVVNLLCDRALEAACTQRVHAIDGTLINTAVVALDLRSEPVRVDLWKSPEDIKKAADADSAKKRAAGRARKAVALIAAVLIAAVALWFGAQAYLERQRAAPPVSAPEPAPAAVTPPAATPPTATTQAPTPAAPVPAATSAGIVAAAAPAADPPTVARDGTPKTTTAGPFEIVVASFKTESRAAAVVAEVSDLGLPVRQRVASGWQQVIAGPFASREAADAAHQRLEQSGHAGTKTVPVAR